MRIISHTFPKYYFCLGSPQLCFHHTLQLANPLCVMGKGLVSPGTMKSPHSSIGHRSHLKKSKPHDLSIDKCYSRSSISHKRTSCLADVVNNSGKKDRASGRRQSSCTDEHETRAFACPFYRRSPAFHMDCMQRKLTRIRDVKQHIHRKHSRSSYAAGGSDAISEEIGGELRRHRAARTETAEAEWRNIWKILFRDEPQPRDPYLRTMVEETVQMIQDFWKCEGNQITEEFLKEKGVGAGDAVQNNMSELLEVAHERFERSTLGMKSVGSSIDDVSCRSSVDSQSLPLYPELTDSVSSLSSLSSSIDQFPSQWELEAAGVSDMPTFGGPEGWELVITPRSFPEGNLDQSEEPGFGWTMIEDVERVDCVSHGTLPAHGFEFSVPLS